MSAFIVNRLFDREGGLRVAITDDANVGEIESRIASIEQSHSRIIKAIDRIIDPPTRGPPSEFEIPSPDSLQVRYHRDLVGEFDD